MSKLTKATFKSFLRKNEGNLFIRVKSSFDGMVDGCTSENDRGFVKAERSDSFNKNRVGYKGVWLVHGGGNYFRPYEDEMFIGIEVYNCCGDTIIAVEKTRNVA